MTFRKRLTTIAAWVVGTVVPLTAAVVTQRRSIAVIASFTEWFLTRHARVLLAATIVIALVAVLRQLMARWIVDFLPLSFLAQRLPLYARIVFAAAVLGAGVVTVKYTMIQYRFFSEVTYPKAAMKAWRAKDVVSARETCRRYVALYPQRAASAGVPDTVCTPILESAVMLIQLRGYVARQRIALGAAPELQEEFLAVLDSETNGVYQVPPAIQRAAVMTPQPLTKQSKRPSSFKP